MSGFDFNVVNPLQSQLPQGANTINPATGQPLTLTGGLLFANRGGPKSPYKSDWNNIQPRIGIATACHRLAERTCQLRPRVPRALERRPGRRLHHRLPALDAVHREGAEQRRSGHAMGDAVPVGIPEPLAGELELLTALGTGPTVPNPDFEVPYTDQWMAGVDVAAALQHRAGRSLRRQQGEQTGGDPHHQPRPPVGERQGHSSLGGNTGYLNQTFPNPFAGLVPGQALNAATISAASCCGRTLTSPAGWR